MGFFKAAVAFGTCLLQIFMSWRQTHSLKLFPGLKKAKHSSVCVFTNVSCYNSYPLQATFDPITSPASNRTFSAKLNHVHWKELPMHGSNFSTRLLINSDRIGSDWGADRKQLSISARPESASILFRSFQWAGRFRFHIYWTKMWNPLGKDLFGFRSARFQSC